MRCAAGIPPAPVRATACAPAGVTLALCKVTDQSGLGFEWPRREAAAGAAAGAEGVDGPDGDEDDEAFEASASSEEEEDEGGGPPAAPPV